LLDDGVSEKAGLLDEAVVVVLDDTPKPLKELSFFGCEGAADDAGVPKENPPAGLVFPNPVEVCC